MYQSLNERQDSSQIPDSDAENNHVDDDTDFELNAASCTPQRTWQHFTSFITITTWLPKYRARVSLPKDILAGITVGVLAVPQCMSFATVAGLPPIYGLYNALMALLLYPFLGTSPHLVNGPTAVMSLLTATAIPDSPLHSDLYTGPQACVDDPSGDGCQVRIALIVSVAFLAAVLQICLGLMKAGFLVELVAEPVIVGFTTGSAFLIVGTQLAGLLGISGCASGDANCDFGLSFIDTVANVVHKLDSINAASLIFGLVALVFLFAMKRGVPFLFPKPKGGNGAKQGKGASLSSSSSSSSSSTSGSGLTLVMSLVSNLGPLLVMICSIVIMSKTTTTTTPEPPPTPAHTVFAGGVSGGAGSKVDVFGAPIRNDWGLELVGTVCDVREGNNGPWFPECLPSPHWPLTLAGDLYTIRLEELLSLLPSAVVIALVGYMESMAIAKTVARQQAKGMGYHAQIAPSNELVALGGSMFLCSMFQGYPIDGSFSRTAINGDVGAQSPFAGCVSAVVVAIALLVLMPALKFTPKAALAAIVIIACVKLVNFKEGLFLYRVARRDSVTFTLTVIITLVLGVQAALIAGIICSWMLFLVHRGTARVTLLGHVIPIAPDVRAKPLPRQPREHRRKQAPTKPDKRRGMDASLHEINMDVRRDTILGSDDSDWDDLSDTYIPMGGGGGGGGIGVGGGAVGPVGGGGGVGGVGDDDDDGGSDMNDGGGGRQQEQGNDAEGEGEGTRVSRKDRGNLKRRRNLDPSSPLVDVFGLPGEASVSVHIALLSAFGDLSFRSVAHVKHLVLQLFESVQPGAVVLDCALCESLDGSGLHALRFLSSHLSNLCVPFLLTRVPPAIMATLRQVVSNDRVLARQWFLPSQSSNLLGSERGELEGELHSLFVCPSVRDAVAWVTQHSEHVSVFAQTRTTLRSALHQRRLRFVCAPKTWLAV